MHMDGEIERDLEPTRRFIILCVQIELDIYIKKIVYKQRETSRHAISFSNSFRDRSGT